jgi:probable HAF family extracellular repeat protein
MRPLLRLLCLLALAWLLGVPSSGRAAATQRPTYTVTDIGPVGERSWATGLNESGQVVGYFTTGQVMKDGSPVHHAFRWSRLKGIEDLSPGPRTDSEARGINDYGDVVGIAGPVGERPEWIDYQGFWFHNGRCVLLGGVQSAPFFYPAGINNRGDIVGLAQWDPPYYHAFLWRRGIETVLEDFHDYPKYSAAAVNDAGTIVGWGHNDNAGPLHAFVWKSGHLTDLPTHDPQDEWESRGAYGINQRDEVVGFTGKYAALWEPDGHLVLLPPSASGHEASAHDINESGVVVGHDLEYRPGPPRETALLWLQGRCIDLNTRIPPRSGWRLESAVGVNNYGQIAGYGRHYGRKRAFLLTPS